VNFTREKNVTLMIIGRVRPIADGLELAWAAVFFRSAFKSRISLNFNNMKIIKRPISNFLWGFVGSGIGGLIYSVTSHQEFDWSRNIVFGFIFGAAILFLPISKRK
jgi:hypothetical protein